MHTTQPHARGPAPPPSPRIFSDWPRHIRIGCRPKAVHSSSAASLSCAIFATRKKQETPSVVMSVAMLCSSLSAPVGHSMYLLRPTASLGRPSSRIRCQSCQHTLHELAACQRILDTQAEIPGPTAHHPQWKKPCLPGHWLRTSHELAGGSAIATWLAWKRRSMTAIDGVPLTPLSSTSCGEDGEGEGKNQIPLTALDPLSVIRVGI